jgi:Tol biopolymer transport system component
VVLRLTVEGADDRDPAWSPDGTRIAFSRFDRCSDVDGSGTMLCTGDILIMSSDGSNVARVDPGVPQVPHEHIAAGELRQPAWSPDGRKLAVAVSYCGGDGDCHVNMGLWIIDIAVRDAVAVIPGFESYLTGGRAYPLRPTWRNGATP